MYGFMIPISPFVGSVEKGTVQERSGCWVGQHLGEMAEPGLGWGPGCKEVDELHVCLEGGAEGTRRRISCEWRQGGPGP